MAISPQLMKELEEEFENELDFHMKEWTGALEEKMKASVGGEEEGKVGEAAEWDEEKHPRDHGKFSSKPGAKGKGEESPKGAASQGDKPHPTQTKEFKNWFGDWEKEPEKASKVVGKDGQPSETHRMPSSGGKMMGKSGPIPVYHGTIHGDIGEFDKSKIGSENLYGPGFYFTEDAGIAKEYADKYVVDESGNRKEIAPRIITAYLNVRQPFDIDSELSPVAMGNIKSVVSKMAKKRGADKRIGWLDESLQPDPETGESISPRGNVVYENMAQLVGHEVANNILQSAGYDGITHIGGDRMGGGHHHRVWIAFEPNQIKSVDNRGTFDPGSSKIHEAWDSFQHPRNGDGKFASSPGGHSDRKAKTGGKDDPSGHSFPGSAQHLAAAIPALAHAMPHQHVDPAKPGATAFGEDKILIGALRDAYRKAHPGVSEEEFNRGLIQARRDGLLTLSRADLVNLMHPDDAKKSELSDGNFLAHYVRVPGAAAAEYARHFAAKRAEVETPGGLSSLAEVKPAADGSQPATSAPSPSSSSASAGLSERERHRHTATLAALRASLESGETPMGEKMTAEARKQVERRVKQIEAMLK